MFTFIFTHRLSTGKTVHHYWLCLDTINQIIDIIQHIPLTMLSSSDDCKIYTESNSWPSNGSHHTSPIEHIKSASITLYRNPSLYNVVYLKAPYLALDYIVCTFTYYPRSLLSTICCTTVMQMTHRFIYNVTITMMQSKRLFIDWKNA